MKMSCIFLSLLNAQSANLLMSAFLKQGQCCWWSVPPVACIYRTVYIGMSVYREAFGQCYYRVGRLIAWHWERGTCLLRQCWNYAPQERPYISASAFIVRQISDQSCQNWNADTHCRGKYWTTDDRIRTVINLQSAFAINFSLSLVFVCFVGTIWIVLNKRILIVRNSLSLSDADVAIKTRLKIKSTCMGWKRTRGKAGGRRKYGISFAKTVVIKMEGKFVNNKFTFEESSLCMPHDPVLLSVIIMYPIIAKAFLCHVMPNVVALIRNITVVEFSNDRVSHCL